VDWNILKAEYIAGGTSYRKLADKYGVDRNAVQKIATKEEWPKLKSQAKAKAESKMVNTISSDIAKNSVKINDVADKLLDKIVHLLDELEIADSQTIKQCTSALKDIKEIKGVKSEIDLKEQNARIDKLRKDIEADKIDDEKPYGVVLMPPIMESPTPPSEEEDNG
jgi:Glu-tRNA(Gln) amidotransferase subunit E-like FAD-binding protein